MMWSMLHLLFLLSVTPGFTHKIQELFCVNDYINNITCVWNSFGIDPDVACRLLGTREDYERNIFQSSCDLKPLDRPEQGHSLGGCSFFFKGHYFSSTEHLPKIKVECNGSEAGNLIDYTPIKHIKMHPPGIPVIINGINATWSAGSPLSKKIFAYEFQVKVKREDQLWGEAKILTRLKQEPWMELRVEESGIHHIRVRVKPTQPASSHWSEWSPTASWTSEGEVLPTFVESPDLTLWLVLSGAFFTLIVVMLLVFYKTHINNRKHQYVPDPAKYFQPLNSVHGGNFQKWLSPLFAPECFITAQPGEDISPMEVSGTEVWDVTDSISSTTAAFLLHSDPNTTSDGWNSSGQSSCFSNIGYFYPSGLRTESRPVYFTYQGDHSSLYVTTTSSSYELLELLGRLQREPQSPDSGFGMESVEGKDQVEEEGKDKKERDVVPVDHHSPPPLVLPVSLPAGIPPGPHHPLNLPQLPLHNPESYSAMAPSGSFNAWPVEAALGRSSSMTVEPSCSGYLTIKELQNTYSNKSI
uniref:Interleukin 2 receptor, beta n=1 Tax=Hucho hucho TaxID=62062 RepID=A0A4W5M104_9TELE